MHQNSDYFSKNAKLKIDENWKMENFEKSKIEKWQFLIFFTCY